MLQFVFCARAGAIVRRALFGSFSDASKHYSTFPCQNGIPGTRYVRTASLFRAGENSLSGLDRVKGFSPLD